MARLLVMGHLLQCSGADHLLHDWHSGDHHLGQWDCRMIVVTQLLQ